MAGCGARVGKQLGALREVPAQWAQGGATDGVGAVQPQGGALGEEVERDEQARGTTPTATMAEARRNLTK